LSGWQTRTGGQFGSIQVIDSVHTTADFNTQKDEERQNKPGKPRGTGAHSGGRRPA